MPAKDFVGKDEVIFQVEINGRRVIIHHYIHVIDYPMQGTNPYDRECTEAKTNPWKISSTVTPKTVPQVLAQSGIVPSASTITIFFADLAGQSLGQTAATTITLDPTAAGHGWFIDYTPSLNEEFLPTSKPNEWVAKVEGDAAGKMDLLSVLLHEYGHALGLEHSADSHDFMAATLPPGLRRLPSTDEMALMARLAGELHLAPSDNPDGMLADPSTETTTSNPLAPDPLSLLDLLTVGFVRHLGAEGNGTGTTVDGVYRLSAANPTLTDGSFTSAVGWDTLGSVTIGNGKAVLDESATTQTRLSQTFLIGQNDHALSFTVSGLSLHQATGQQSGPGDAFEVALLDADSLTPLVGTAGLSRSDAVLNLQADGTEARLSGLHRTDNADGSRTYTLDVSRIAAGTAVTLFFDLVGFGTADSSVTLSHVHFQDVMLQAQNDQASLAEDNPALLTVLVNDTYTQSVRLLPVVVTGPAHGTATVNPDGTLAYTPNQNYFGPDVFTYKLSDGLAESNVATVNLTITPINDAPVTTAASFTLGEDTPIRLDLLGHVSDVDSTALSVSMRDGPTHGTLTRNDNGTFTYIPATDYNGTDSFTYQANDGVLDSNVVTASLTITPVNDRPVLNPIRSMTVDEGHPLSFMAVASDVDNDVLTFSLLDPPRGAAIDPVTGRFTWTPADGNATYHFTLRVSDPGGLSAERGFDIQVDNIAPKLTAGGYHQTYPGEPAVLNLPSRASSQDTLNSGQAPDQDTLSVWTLDGGDGTVETISDNPPTVTYPATVPSAVAIPASATDVDGRYDLAPLALTVPAAPLEVTQELSGFDQPEIPPLPTAEALAAARAEATAPAAAVKARPTAGTTDHHAGAATPTLATAATSVSTATVPKGNRETTAASLPATAGHRVAGATEQSANRVSSQPRATPAAPVRLDLSRSYADLSFPTHGRPAKSDWRQAFVTNLAAPMIIADNPNATLWFSLPPRLETTRQKEKHAR